VTLLTDPATSCGVPAGRVLYDAEVGHDDESVEKVIDEVNVECLDLLPDLTGDEFMGSQTIGALSAARSRS
jgi:hypothetical protein